MSPIHIPVGQSLTDSTSVAIIAVLVFVVAIIVATAIALLRAQRSRSWPMGNQFCCASSATDVQPVVIPVVLATVVYDCRDVQMQNESNPGNLLEELEPVPHTPPPPYNSVCPVPLPGTAAED